MYYDSIYNEWHLWDESPPNFKLGPPIDDVDESDDWAPVPDGQYLENDTILAPDVSADSFKEDIAAFYGIRLEKTEGHFAEAYETARGFPLSERLEHWYGFIPDAKINKWDQVRIPPGLDNEYVKHALRDSLSNINEEHLCVIRQFVASLVLKAKNPSPLSDLHGRVITDFGNPSVRVHRSLYSAQEFVDAKSPFIPLYSVEIIDGDGRVVEDRERRRFFVWDATTALAIKRLHRSHTRSIGHIAPVFYLSVVSHTFLQSQLCGLPFPPTTSVSPASVLGQRI